MSHSKTSSEYSTFENALKTVVSVPRDELKRREEAYQRERAPQKKKRAKTSPASRASTDKD
ncbi:MAG: hypothetical protein JWM08_953 [Candidatus Angelobacter sp.]|nr:hypothetical protein [Candidatus Angelobacter sp.]